VRSEISKKLKISNEALLSLGAERETADQKSRYLLNIFIEFQNIVSLALTTNYGGHDLFDQDENLRLATVVRNRDEEFSEDLARWGQEYRFASPQGGGIHWEGKNNHIKDNTVPLKYFLPSDAIPDERSVVSGKTDTKSLHVRKRNNPSELEDILYNNEKLFEPSGNGILTWIEGTYRTARGFEIGTFSSTLLSTIMKKQSAKWTGIALGYISDIIVVVHNFIVKVLESVCPDDRVRSNLLSLLMDELVSKYKKALEHVKFLLSVERVGTLMTFDHRFEQKIGER
jgi:hypothetical protein